MKAGWTAVTGLALAGLALFAGVAALAPKSLAAPPFPDRYDDRIEDAWDRFMPGLDWRWYKAQLYQESQLQPDAESPVGAEGIAQFMPGTWERVRRHFGWETVSPRAVGPAITAGAWYMGRLWGEWSAPRPAADRLSLAQASYNAGMGNLLRAQSLAGGAALYRPIIEELPEVTGEHARETRTYVRNIFRWRRMMVVGR